MKLAPSDRINNKFPKYQIGEIARVEVDGFRDEWGLITGIAWQSSEKKFRYELTFYPEDLTAHFWEDVVIKTFRIESSYFWKNEGEKVFTVLYTDYDSCDRQSFIEAVFHYYFNLIKEHPEIRYITEKTQAWEYQDVIKKGCDQEIIEVLDKKCVEEGYREIEYNPSEGRDKPSYYDLLEADRFDDFGDERKKRIWINLFPNF